MTTNMLVWNTMANVSVELRSMALKSLNHIVPFPARETIPRPVAEMTTSTSTRTLHSLL
jgi:hypothetical protein